MTSQLLKSVRAISNLESAWRVIRDNGRLSKSGEIKLELEEFDEAAPAKLRNLNRALQRKTFKFEKAKAVAIPKRDVRGRKTGKIRPIVISPVASRIVQRALLNVLIDIPQLQDYIKTPYSFGGIRKDKAAVSEGVEKSDNLSAVPAAIRAILEEISSGATYVASADIRAFFTKIPKSRVSSIIRKSVKDEEFVDFFDRAIDVELSNISDIRDHLLDFPIEDIGVAQGNSLSPLLGNIILRDFDEEMNSGDCRCVRYIDDFLILAPTEKAANARLRKAENILKSLGMELSPEKSSKGATHIRSGFDFLGINICPGKIRPSVKAKEKFLRSIEIELNEGLKALRKAKNGGDLPRHLSFLSVMTRVNGKIDGWSKHYWFCNDTDLFKSIDDRINLYVRSFMGGYSNIRKDLDIAMRAKLFGINQLSNMKRNSFVYKSAELNGTKK